MQIAGVSCCECNKKIVSVLDGEGCDECQNCFHNDCVVNSKVCPKCNNNIQKNSIEKSITQNEKKHMPITLWVTLIATIIFTVLFMIGILTGFSELNLDDSSNLSILGWFQILWFPLGIILTLFFMINGILNRKKYGRSLLIWSIFTGTDSI